MAKGKAAAYGAHAGLNDDLFLSIEQDEQGNLGLGIFIQDSTTPVVDYYFTQPINFYTIPNPTILDVRTCPVDPGHGIVVDNMVEMYEDQNFSQFQVLAVNGDIITLDSAMDKVYTSAAICQVGSRELLVDGSTVPQVFSIRPTPGMVWDIARIIMVIKSGGGQDFSTFGNAPELENGCLLRQNNGVQHNIFNFKSNGEFINRSSEHSFQSKIGGGVFGFNARTTFAGQNTRGVALRLVGADNDQLEIIIQDDLTDPSGPSANLSFHMIAQGHVSQEDLP